MNDKLNKKLGDWAGFEQTGKSIWKRGAVILVVLRFTKSLDACFKWLVPKLEPLGYDLVIKNDLELMGWSVCLSNTKSECSIASPMEHCELDGIALALCLAIEKLIDGEKK